MAWFYIPILHRFSRIGLVAPRAGSYGPAGNHGPQIHVFLKEFAFLAKRAPRKRSKNVFLNGLLYQANSSLFCLWEKDSLVCSSSSSTSRFRSSFAAFAAYPSRSRTLSLKTFPSTVFPSSFARAALITAPICFNESAPVSAIASSMAREISASLGAGGR